MIGRRPPRCNPAMLLGVLCALPGLSHAGAPPLVEHRLTVTLVPDRHWLDAEDELRLPQETLTLALHRDLHPSADTARLEPLGHTGHWAFYRARTEDGRLRLRYRGRLHHPLATVRAGVGRSEQVTLGTIDPAGVFLGGASGWYPRIDGYLLQFQLQVTVPDGWLAVSQGAGPTITPAGADHSVRIHWREEQPQDELYLIAGRYRLYRQPGALAEAQVWLREADAALAQRYLAATEPYLRRYHTLLGPYPYAKFALVENFWESGYGMPSFTLLGPQTIRLPFIRDTAYPHEILHNWWGNGVLIAPAEGNWSEGLTAYLADHLQRELAGSGAEYRREQLQAYADHVDTERALADFRARHDPAEQALGYGKGLMVFHMLRMMLGDEMFIAGLRRFYAEWRGRFAGFTALRQAFANASGRELDEFFTHWIQRPGAPELALPTVVTEPQADGTILLRGTVAQTQNTAPYPLTVPVVVHERAGPLHELRLTFADGARSVPFTVLLSSPPLRVAVDPAFDTFRRLVAGEAPPSLSALFGAPRGLILLPAAAPEPLRAAYQDLAQRWCAGHEGWTVTTDQALAELPRDRALWLLGWENRWLAALQSPVALEPAARRLTAAGRTWDQASVVVVTKRENQPLGWLASDQPVAVSGLARKVPHYGGYGLLVFTGPAPDNQVKQQWPVTDSALMHWFDEARPVLPLPVRPALVGTEG